MRLEIGKLPAKNINVRSVLSEEILPSGKRRESLCDQRITLGAAERLDLTKCCSVGEYVANKAFGPGYTGVGQHSVELLP